MRKTSDMILFPVPSPSSTSGLTKWYLLPSSPVSMFLEERSAMLMLAMMVPRVSYSVSKGGCGGSGDGEKRGRKYRGMGRGIRER